jgi:four helix bundle protein
VSDYKKLDVWEYAHALVLNVHSAAKEIRGVEVLSLKSQMTRAAMSIPTNLVEGCGQKSAREFARFIRISLNSASELEYQLLLARDLDAMREKPTGHSQIKLCACERCCTDSSEVFLARRKEMNLDQEERKTRNQ